MVVSVSQSVSQLGSYRGPTAITRCQKHEQACPCCAYNTRRTPLQHTVIWCLRLVSEKVAEAATFFLVFQICCLQCTRRVYSLDFGGTGRSRSKGIRASGTLESTLDWTGLDLSSIHTRLSRLSC